MSRWRTVTICLALAAITLDLDAAQTPSSRAAVVRPKLLWRSQTPPGGDFVLALAVGKDATVYAGSWIGDSVQGFAADGSLRRALSPSHGVKALAVASDGTVYVGTNDYTIDVFSEDGTPRSPIVLRKVQSGGLIQALAIGPDGSLYAAAANDLYGLDRNGEVEWRSTMQVPVDALAIGTNGDVYAGAGDTVHVFDPRGGPKKKYGVGIRPGVIDAVSIVAVYAARRDVLYVGTRNRIVYAVNLERGSIDWTFRPNGTPFALLEGQDGAVYVGSYDGNVYALNPANGRLRWRFSTGRGRWGQNAVHALAQANGSILYAAVGQSVEAIDLAH